MHEDDDFKQDDFKQDVRRRLNGLEKDVDALTALKNWIIGAVFGIGAVVGSSAKAVLGALMK